MEKINNQALNSDSSNGLENSTISTFPVILSPMKSQMVQNGTSKEKNRISQKSIDSKFKNFENSKKVGNSKSQTRNELKEMVQIGKYAETLINQMRSSLWANRPAIHI